MRNGGQRGKRKHGGKRLELRSNVHGILLVGWREIRASSRR